MDDKQITDVAVRKWHKQILPLKWEIENMGGPFLIENMGEKETAESCPLFRRGMLGIEIWNPGHTLTATWIVMPYELQGLDMRFLAERIVRVILESLSKEA